MGTLVSNELTFLMISVLPILNFRYDLLHIQLEVVAGIKENQQPQ